MEFGDDAENAEPSEEISLAARLSKKTKAQTKEKEGSKTSKQSTLQFKPVAKKPKKNPWSDEESDDLSAGSEMEVEEVVAPRERIERKTKAVMKYSMSDSEDEFDDWE
ncbi:DNA topoisomerase 2-alpha [Larimichthys crocea]|uniref:Uncharacterized protein n=1 Tax=Larimichthys crocea TaxID=215358 RepID=A0ACD3RQG4_LARCR|nr:DNA topoisomerase 2-alpha [Larimichthys crocea]